MSLFDKLKLEELNKVIHDLSFNKHQSDRKEIAHFCEHDGISIRFTRARSAWHALAPCALKPWWLSLQPMKKLHEKTHKKQHNNATQ